MGVPAFFAWLSKKYPSIVVHCVEEKPKEVSGVKIPVDISKPNPNDVEFDNLYLDMNGIIHPCSHPEDKPAPKNVDEMMIAIFEAIDRMMAIVRPQKLLYMAIDGVAPRAKMNQQRKRRFFAAKESRDGKEELARIREELEGQGIHLPPEKTNEEHFDSNCITPGTEFMHYLSECLRYYIHERLNNNPGWRNIKVILSDANVPGEGEHKIMDYIRRQRAQPDHDPNTHHCLCGADADLIMLGLATHEPHFTIIREEFKYGKPRPCKLCNQLGHEAKECQGLAKNKDGEFDELAPVMGEEATFIFIRLNVLREYLEQEMMITGLPFEYDLERAIDDWVFMCFFVGNDFLPHLPSLQIREGAIDRLIRIYKRTIHKTGGYLTDNGLVNLSRVQVILTELGKDEDEIFKKRQENELNFRARTKARKRREKQQRMMQGRPAWTPDGQYSPQPIGQTPSPIQNPRQAAAQGRADSANKRAADDLRNMLARNGEGTPDRTPGSRGSTPGSGGFKSPAQTPYSRQYTPRSGEKRKLDQADLDSDEEEEPADDVRLWEDGWRERYYVAKFDADPNDEEFRHSVAAAYTEGLCWVMLYYYQGCPSWKWFFPFHYAPFASDFVNIGDLPNTFEKGTKPFNPLEQLMGVFPAASKQFLPTSWAELMINPDSPIIDLYPDDFRIDLNGKKYTWQGVALLPFVDEVRLLKAIDAVRGDLTAGELYRNSLGADRLYLRDGHPAFSFFQGLYQDNLQEAELNSNLTQGMRGVIKPDNLAIMPNNTVKSPLPNLRDVFNNQTLGVLYKDPSYAEDYIFPAKVLPNAKMPDRVLKPGDFERHQQQANRGRGRGRGGGYRPQLGFTRDSGHGARLSDSGHRMLQHGVNRASLLGSPPQMMGSPSFQSPPYNRGSNYNSPSPHNRGGSYNSPSPYNRGRDYNSPSPHSRQGGSGGYRNDVYQQRQGGYPHPGGSSSSTPSRWGHNQVQQAVSYGIQQLRNQQGGGYPTPPGGGYPTPPGGGYGNSDNQRREDPRRRDDPRRQSFPPNRGGRGGYPQQSRGWY
ncbi:5'-3' exoribonuclease 2-like isoform X1 [Branchiostoma floridae x Branchiostoma japonicum]